MADKKIYDNLCCFSLFSRGRRGDLLQTIAGSEASGTETRTPRKAQAIIKIEGNFSFKLTKLANENTVTDEMRDTNASNVQRDKQRRQQLGREDRGNKQEASKTAGSIRK